MADNEFIEKISGIIYFRIKEAVNSEKPLKKKEKKRQK